jgi:hypothetical protein
MKTAVYSGIQLRGDDEGARLRVRSGHWWALEPFGQRNFSYDSLVSQNREKLLDEGPCEKSVHISVWSSHLAQVLRVPRHPVDEPFLSVSDEARELKSHRENELGTVQANTTGRPLPPSHCEYAGGFLNNQKGRFRD